MAKKKVGDLVDKGNGRFLLKNVRLSFPYLFEPDEHEDDNGNKKKSYRVTLLLPKATHKPVAQKLSRLISEMCEEEYGNPKLAADRKFLRDGDESDVEDHHGCWTVTVRETRKPILVDRDRQPTEEDDELLYSGAWANVVIRPWAQNGKSMKKKNKYGKRINAGFDIVQFVDHDDNLAGNARPDVDEVLDELEDDFEDDDSSTSRSKSKSKSKGRSRDEDDDDDGLGDDDDDDSSSRRSRSSKSKTSSKSRRSRDEDDDEDDDDLGI
ncbi:ligase [Xylella phage Salvo]|uniref:Ligase n=1 Tax=Xylella phage Salvo TaxID=1415147 RepID=V5Q7Z2_9CAUD|nr:Gp2.5-like ssDNA binding protein and ssDNA annealing protein [Xylella phage Salvo]AHB12267.1 ligase [Xylella phage Salvo]